MPIKDLSESVRLPRLGKIHLGTKHPEKGYPMKADHFIFPEEHSDYKRLVELYGDNPKELPILIPVEDEETWASQYYKSYNLTYGLVCKGDGELAMRMVDINTGELPDAKKAGTVSLQEIPCLGRDCPEYKSKKCHEVMNFRFILPEVPGLGIWQIDTGSKNSILNINSCAKIIKRAFGRISMIPLKLTFEPIQVNNPESGKKQTVYTLNLRTNVTMAQLADAAREQSQTFKLEMPDVEELWGDGEETVKELPPVDVEESTGEIIDKPKPKAIEAKSTPQKAAPARKQEPAVTPPQSTTAAENVEPEKDTPPAPAIDMTWLKESLQSLNWNTCGKYLMDNYGATGSAVREMVLSLTPEQQKEFGKEVEDRLSML
jgi:hypothetical protein